jgi:hypothetical protein
VCLDGNNSVWLILIEAIVPRTPLDHSGDAAPTASVFLKDIDVVPKIGLATVTVKHGIRHRNTVTKPCHGARQTFACGTDTTQERAVWMVR